MSSPSSVQREAAGELAAALDDPHALALGGIAAPDGVPDGSDDHLLEAIVDAILATVDATVERDDLLEIALAELAADLDPPAHVGASAGRGRARRARRSSRATRIDLAWSRSSSHSSAVRRKGSAITSPLLSEIAASTRPSRIATRWGPGGGNRRDSSSARR